MKKKYLILFQSTNKFNLYLSNIKSLLLLFVIFSASIVYGQSADCSNATLLTINGAPVTGTISDGVVNDPIASACAGGAVSKDGWYRFVATSSIATVVVESNNRQLVLYAYSGTCLGLTQISCSNANTTGGAQTEIMSLTGLTPLDTYYVRVVNSTNNNMTLNAVSVSDGYLVPKTGSNSITTCAVNLYDNGGAGSNYATSSDGYTVINPSIVGSLVQVSGTITVEGGFDFLTIYDGSGTGGTVLWGGSEHGTGTTCTTFSVPTITSTTGPLTVRFFSDSSNNCAGFNLSLSCYTPLPCTTPTNQPTVLSLTSVSTTINGSFTAASPAPNNYLVVISTSATPPSPVNGTSYTIGSTIGSGYSVVDTDANTSFTVSGLLGNTLYYVYIFSNNTICSGGPLYNLLSPLTGNVTTLSVTYCSPTSWDPEGLYITNVAFVGTLNDPPVNVSTFNTTGFQNFTTLPIKAIQAQGEGINIVAGVDGAVHGRGTWKAWVDWNKNGTFQTATEEVYNIQGFAGADATFGFVIPASTPPGDYRIRIRVNNGTDNFFGDETFGFDFLPCDDFEEFAPYDFFIDDYGETEDYLFTVVAKCNMLITTIDHGETCGSGTVELGATATAGVTEFRWYTTATGGSYTTSTVVGNSTTFTTPTLSTTTNYYVTAWNGTCESQVRTLVRAKVSPVPIVVFNPANPMVCGDKDVISLTASGDTEIVHLINENFESAGLGVFSNVNNDTNNSVIDAITSWKNQTSTFVPSTTNVWFPAISSGFGTNKFALAYSDSNPTATTTVENSITLSTAVNTSSFLNLTLKLKLYYSRYFPDGYISGTADEYVRIELSTNGGTTYPIILQTFSSDIGIGTRFTEFSYDLSAYINQPNLKIRIKHRSFAGAGWLPDGVAIDDVELFGTKPLNTAFNYDTASVTAFANPEATIPYVSGTPASIVYIKPTLLQLENASFSIPVSATLSNGCFATGTVAVSNNTKIFSAGTSGTDWNSATNWKPTGIPTADNCVIIIDDEVNVTGTNYAGYGLNLTVKPTGNLNIASTNSTVVTNAVIVEPNGVFEIENNASLVQINNVANSGNITYKRNANVRKFDYVYWSSPVAGFNVSTIASPLTLGPIFKWNPTYINPNGSEGYWLNAAGNTMIPGKGYIARAPNSFSSSVHSTLNGVFIGSPNNGLITIPISRGTDTNTGYHTGANGVEVTNFSDNWNLIGNPYPSSIRGSQFLFNNSSKIEGNINLWTHGTIPSAITNPFYDTFVYNYTPNDYLTYNFTGVTCCPAAGSDLIIGSGQGFFVQMVDGTTASDFVTFDNSLRSASYDNSQFYRSSNPNTLNNQNLVDIERHRIWLDVIDSNLSSNRTLVGYIEGASMERDSFFDSKIAVGNYLAIYSLINDSKYNIQGRALPFDVNDEVSIGVNIPASGAYSIAIAGIDGLFNSQNIYLKDTLLNNIYDIKTNPYTFEALAGTYNDRFKIVYQSSTLNNPNFDINNEIKVITNTSIKVISSNQTINSIIVYDLLGRKINEYFNVNSQDFEISNRLKNNSALFLNIILENGNVVTKKIIF